MRKEKKPSRKKIVLTDSRGSPLYQRRKEPPPLDLRVSANKGGLFASVLDFRFRRSRKFLRFGVSFWSISFIKSMILEVETQNFYSLRRANPETSKNSILNRFNRPKSYKCILDSIFIRFKYKRSRNSTYAYR